jgi:enterochelin esterase-like enzyme
LQSIIKKTKPPYLLLIIVVLSSIFTHVEAADDNKIPEVKKPVFGEYFKGKYVGKSIFTSKITGVTYPYHVYLPASYEKNAEKLYPIIYTLDGQWNFKGFAISIERDNRDIIVVAIEEGPEKSDRRAIDYRLPGAMLYLDFFRQEFLPSIESTYRIDPSNRSFQGTSLSGIITTALLFLDNHKKPLFKNYIAYDVSYWDKPKLMQDLIEKRLQIGNRIDSNLYLTTAFPLGNHFYVMDFIDSLEEYAIPGLNIHHEWYMVMHNDIFSASIDDTLDLIYGKTNKM